MSAEWDKTLADLFEAFEGSEPAHDYAQRHNIEAQACLTVTDDEIADLIAERLEPRLSGKVVVEIGGGIGLLSCHIAQFAKRVYCIEANPAWSFVFASFLYLKKPKNCSFLMGSAEEFLGSIKGDVAIFCSHSGLQSMRLIASQFAPKVIDFYSELIAESPGSFDKVASALRQFA
jgi:precorrin-6B methylase 2